MIRAQRAGGSQNSPWLVHLQDVDTRWGPKPGVQVEANEPTAKSEAKRKQAPWLLSQLREQLVVDEPERRWWQRNES
jgi:hypothetical protein